MKRFFLSVLMLVFLFFLLVGTFQCSPKEDVNVKTLIYAGPGSTEEIDVMNKAFRLFEKENPGVKIKFVHSSWNEYWPKLETMIAGGTPPDVVYMGGGFLQSLAKKGALLDLENLFAKDSKIRKTDFFRESLNGAIYKGDLYGIPRDVGPFVLFYNKDMFDAYNVPYPTDWDWNDVIKYGKIFTRDLDGDDIVDQFGYDMAGGYEEYMRAIWSYGGSILNADKTRMTMDSAGARKALTILRDVINKYKISPALTKRGGMNFFETGKIAMHPDGYWMVAHYEKNLPFKFGVAPLIKGDKRVGFLSETVYSIPSSSQNKDLAWKLLKFLVSDKIEKLYATSGLAIPASKKIAHSKDVLSLPNMKIFVQSVEYSKTPPFIPEWNEMIDIMQREMEKYYLGQYTVEQLIKSCKVKVDALLMKERQRG